MKKYPAAKLYRWVLVVCLLAGVVIEVSLIGGAEEDRPSAFLLIIMHGIGIMEIVLSLYGIFFDIGSARFSFDEEGITMYMGFRKHEFKWEEFTDAGIIGLDVGDSRNRINTYWIYFSKTYLMNIEKMRFIKTFTKEPDRVALFQCNGKLFRQVLEFLPEKLRKTLMWDGEYCLVWQNGARE